MKRHRAQGLDRESVKDWWVANEKKMRIHVLTRIEIERLLS